MNEGRLTPDGKWRWNGAAWGPVTPGEPTGTPPATPPGPRRQWWTNRWLQAGVGGLVLLLIGIGIGAASGGGSSKNAAASTPAAPVTVTSVAAGETATVSTTTMETATATVTTTYTPVPQTAFAGDGTFLVGKEVAPGTYESDGPSPDGPGECSYSVNRQGSGIDSIITNGNSAGQTIIQVPASAYTVLTQGCDPFHKV